MTSQNTGFNV